MRLRTSLDSCLIGATALVLVGATFVPGGAAPTPADRSVLSNTKMAVAKLSYGVRPLSHPKALETAFRSYFAFRAEHPKQVTKPFLYFVDYGLPSTKPRGYVFDMEALRLVEGPFPVAHGRGSSTTRYGIPTSFSNRPGSAATSLGLYLAEEMYDFNGNTAGRRYRSIGLRLKGLSRGFNDNARDRGVVAHGAPYVNDKRAGRSEGCPAMEQARAHRLLPRLAGGGMVFLFAPEKAWMSDDPWVVASSN